MLFLKTPIDFLTKTEALLGIPAVYLFFVFVLSKYMTSRTDITKPIVPKSIMFIYNTFQVALNIYMAWGVFGPKGYRFESVYGINEEFTEHLEWMGLVHYISKYIDFLDTLFIILNKSWGRLNLLHVYHHASIPIVWGYLLQEGVCNGTALFGAGINSIIHVIMYSHYLITSLGLPNPFKVLITQAQLIQFFMCEYHVYRVYNDEKSIIREYTTIQLCYHITMITLFSKFYYDTYINPPKSDRPPRKVEKQEGVKAD